MKEKDLPGEDFVLLKKEDLRLEENLSTNVINDLVFTLKYLQGLR